MWLLAVINALGLIIGTLTNETVLYIFFGVSFVAFFHKYAQISWKLIYEKESWLVGLDGKMNMVVANEFVCLWVLVGIYWLMVTKVGAWCAIASVLQCMVFQLVNLGKERSGRDFVITIILVVEFILSIAIVLF